MLDREINLIRNTPLKKMDEQFIAELGLNDEILWEQPREYSNYFGRGLHIWQYPNQISPFIRHVGNEFVHTYMEIGTHKGGTFILMTEILAKINPNIISIACDIIPMGPILQEYRKYRNFIYFQGDSTGYQFKSFCQNNYIDFAFIDGEHLYDFVKSDHSIFKNKSETKHTVFHDIVNSACPDVSVYWDEIKNNQTDEYIEFVQQYASVPNGPYLGIGYLKKN
jgi:hypothetical protein